MCGRKRQRAGWLENMVGAGHLPQPTESEDENDREGKKAELGKLEDGG